MAPASNVLRVLQVLFVLFLCAGLALGGWIGWFYWHSRTGGAQLLARARRQIDAGPRSGAPSARCTPVHGAPAAEVVIPSIALVAPVVQGDGDAALADAVGHVPASVWPGEPGTTVLVGHDVTWFHDLGELRGGDEIEYVSRCTALVYRVTGTQVVASGTAIRDTPGALALVTCWPLDALWFTGRRLVVSAVEVGGARHAQAVVVPQAPAPPALAVPPALASADSLATNPTPLGTLGISGDPSPTYGESPGPLADAGAAQCTYFAGVRAASDGSAAEWATLAPGVPFATAAPLAGGGVVQYLGALTTTLSVSGSALTGASLGAEVELSGPNAGAWDVSVGETVVNGRLEVSAWRMEPA